MKVYRLAIPMADIVQHLEKQTRVNASKTMENIEKLKKINFSKNKLY